MTEPTSSAEIFAGDTQKIFEIYGTSFFVGFVGVVRAVHLIDKYGSRIERIYIFFSVIVPFRTPEPDSFGIHACSKVRHVEMPIPSLLVRERYAGCGCFGNRRPSG